MIPWTDFKWSWKISSAKQCYCQDCFESSYGSLCFMTPWTDFDPITCFDKCVCNRQTDRQTDKQNCHSIQCLHASHAQSKQTSDVHVSQLPICNELRWDSCVNTPVNSFADTATSDVNVYHTNKRKTASVIKTQHDVSSKLQVECDFGLINDTTISTQCSWKLTLNVFSSLLFVSFSQCTFYITCTLVHVCSWVGDALQATMPSCYSHYYHRH